MVSPRARMVVAHALAWIGWGIAAGVAAQQAVPPASLALAGAITALVAALGLALPVRAAPARHAAIALLVTLSVEVAIGAGALLAADAERLGALGVAAGAAGLQLRAARAAADDDPSLAPALRLAPTLAALAGGSALAAAAAALGVGAILPLAAVVVLHLGALGLLVAGRAAAPRRAGAAPVAALGGAWPLLLLAAGGAAAVVALRPALSALGGVEPQAAGPTALALAIGALLGPPLARVAERLPRGAGAPALATLAGTAALAAPVARPGALDLVAAAVLGLGAAAAVALAEVARRRGASPAPRQLAVLALAAAGGAGVAALLLTSVPVADVVLGAAIACLVAGLGAWAPGVRERVAA